jgi:hypothetical protein
MFCVPCIVSQVYTNRQIHNIIFMCKIYFQPLHMFRQVDCHLQGVYGNLFAETCVGVASTSYTYK